MKRWVYITVSVLLSISGYSQNFAIKSNVLYDATTSINLGVEYALTDKLTLDVSLNYNPWVFPQQEVDIKGKPVKEWDGKFKHLMIQPELRWWLCEKFNRHFIGAHIHYANYNVGGLTFLPDGFGEHGTWNKTTQEYDYSDGIQNNRFEGWLAGGGVSYGYHLLLNSRFSLEFTLGLGYAYLSYDKYNCEVCGGTKLASSTMHYLGPTKAGISAIFMLK